ncbi:hypothetical protein [Maritimibacter dapengensis]|uniref:Uncharacterized protein n=1 Tax=Maritimibacter dapengensis TaxID=2836868 RepID=A0ABS6T3W9_9RHOB|nr:hypothetical protein [Maritimibacter dapengensis]MBV7379829.1 hypothetical protein [Maritimibacter dapengensis]
MVIGVLALAMIFGATAAVMFAGQSIVFGIVLYSIVGSGAAIVLFTGLYFCRAMANRLTRNEQADLEPFGHRAG